ncbi:MAG: sugar phosphate nucleotidyltransferase, partial [Planctomycetota bacterium]
MYDSRTRDGVVAVVMAGGEGSRLRPLTSVRAKPAVRFGGIWRIIDFTLSNCVNSGIRQILVLTQYKSDSLNLHLDRAWSFLSHELGEFVWNMPPQMRNGGDWYQGTADAVWQNLWKLRAARPKRVVILSADHVYKMDYRRMLAFQEARGADVLIAAHPVPRAEANGFGVIAVDVDGRVREFVEKPGPTVVPPTMPGRPDTCLANMGIYSFPAELLFDVLDEFPGNGGGTDFGRDILPALVARGEAVYAWPFEDENGDVRGPYWRDVGTLDALHAANMDLVS